MPPLLLRVRLGGRNYHYRGTARVGDYVACPPNIVKPEGTIGRVVGFDTEEWVTQRRYMQGIET